MASYNIFYSKVYIQVKTVVICMPWKKQISFILSTGRVKSHLAQIRMDLTDFTGINNVILITRADLIILEWLFLLDKLVIEMLQEIKYSAPSSQWGVWVPGAELRWVWTIPYPFRKKDPALCVQKMPVAWVPEYHHLIYLLCDSLINHFFAFHDTEFYTETPPPLQDWVCGSRELCVN